jgi:Domain of unknown function (DUF4402)
MSRLFSFHLVGVCVLLCPAAAHAAFRGASPPATGRALILLPTTVTKVDDLDFGSLSVTTAGTAVLNSNTNAVTTTGGVLLLGGKPHAASFVATSPSRAVVKISLPNKATTVTRIGGTETMTIDTWNINGTQTRNVVAHQQFEFKVGGTLHVGANQVEGLYTGTFNVTVNYN